MQGRNNLIRLFKVGGVAEKLRQGTIDLAPQDICPIVVPNYSQDSFLF